MWVRKFDVLSGTLSGLSCAMLVRLEIVEDTTGNLASRLGMRRRAETIGQPVAFIPKSERTTSGIVRTT